MTEDEILMLGEYANNLLDSDLFALLLQQYELACFRNWSMTDAKHIKEREGYYAQMRAIQDFLAHLKGVWMQANAIIERNNALSEDDAHIDGID